MRLGFFLPHLGPAADPDAVLTVATAAEDMGYESLWVTERLLFPLEPKTPYPGSPDGKMPELYQDVIDPLSSLTFVAARTSRIRLGTSVLNLPWYSPVLLARQLTAVDVLSGGRLLVGFGMGWSADEYDAVGADMSNRGKRADEALEVLHAIWTSDPVEFHGTFYTVPRSIIRPKPVQKPHPPIYMAAYSPGAMARIARYADGWMPAGVPVEGMAEMFGGIKAMAAEAGRDPDALEMPVRANVVITDAPLGDDRMIFTGSSEQIAADIAAVRDVGTTELSFDPVFDPAVQTEADFLERMKQLWGLATS
jgi:probable F420-dependent oxidoreductase